MEAGGVEPSAAAPDTQAATAGQDTDGLPPSLTVLVPRKDCEVVTVRFRLSGVKSEAYQGKEQGRPNTSSVQWRLAFVLPGMPIDLMHLPAALCNTVLCTFFCSLYSRLHSFQA